MGDSFSREQIEQARTKAFKVIKDWLYEDQQYGVNDDGYQLRHNIADFDTGLKNLETEILQQQAFTRTQLIEFFLEKSQSILEGKHSKGQREDIMCITQFADALGVRQEMEQTKRHRAESQKIRWS